MVFWALSIKINGKKTLSIRINGKRAAKYRDTGLLPTCRYRVDLFQTRSAAWVPTLGY
jgi:hypothetical protein